MRGVEQLVPARLRRVERVVRRAVAARRAVAHAAPQLLRRSEMGWPELCELQSLGMGWRSTPAPEEGEAQGVAARLGRLRGDDDRLGQGEGEALIRVVWFQQRAQGLGLEHLS